MVETTAEMKVSQMAAPLDPTTAAATVDRSVDQMAARTVELKANMKVELRVARTALREDSTAV